ncbi:MAG: DUF2867 domain-containing protein [Proteobacteria bacterium]|nr:DUF2867 domain-containing protein [Pseudomonadota bacterium]
MIRTTEVPKDSEITKHLAGAHLFDAYELPTDGRNRSALEIYIDIMTQTPEWIHCLMEARNRVVALFGLKNLGHLDNVDTRKKPESYRVGDRIGIFSILFLSEREIVLVESDTHLDAKVSVCKMDTGQGNSAVMTTVIHLHNLLGRAYILLVWPVHKLIVPSLLKRSTRSGRSL